MLKAPDSLADYEWPPIELVLDRFEADLSGAGVDDQHNCPLQATGCSLGLQPEFRRPNGDANGVGNGHAFGDDPDTTRVMLRLYRDVAAGLDGLFVLTVIDACTRKVLPQRFAINDVDGIVAEAGARADVANVYFAPAVIKKSLPAGARGMLGDIAAVLGVVIDDDGDTGKRGVLPPGIKPSLEVTTCWVPFVNRQHHYVFTRPLPVGVAQKLAKLLHRKCGGDHGTADVDHVWRLPGTKNHPNKTKITERGRPFEPQDVKLTGGSLERIDPDEFRCALEAMSDAHAAREDRTHRNGTAGGNYMGGSTDRSEIIARLSCDVNDLVETEIIEGEGDRSAHSFRTMMVLMEHGLTDDEIRLVAKDAPFAAKFRERGDLDEEIGRVRVKWEVEGAQQCDQGRTASADTQAQAQHGNGREKKSKGPTQAQLLIEIATGKDVELYHSPDGTTYADIIVGTHRETWATRSSSFGRWLRREFYKRTGGAP